MRYLQRERNTEVNTGSMADIAFLLLIFFLVTTTIETDKGIMMKLPNKITEEVPLNKRNVFDILINSDNEILAEDERIELPQLKQKAKAFIDNKGRNEFSSDSPTKAVISIKTDRGTTYATYLSVLDELKLSYNELRAAHLHLSLEDYLKLDAKKINDKALLNDARKAYPMQISDAEPTDIALE